MGNIIQTTIDTLGIVSSILLGGTILIIGISLLIFFIKILLITTRLYSNLKRNILVITPDSSSEYAMSREIRLLNNNLFKKVTHIDRYEDVSELSNYSLIILGYDEEKHPCKDLITQIKNSDKSIPVIIYTYNKRIKDHSFIEAYIYHTFANTPVSLLDTSYGIMSIYNNKALGK